MHVRPSTVKILEVIVTSLAEALEAEAGGAGRLEVVRSLAEGGLSPDCELVRQIVENVSIPARIMVRETSSMCITSDSELALLQAQAVAFARLPIDGLVLGWVRDGQIDLVSTRAVLSAVTCPATFHRAFESATDPLQAIRSLKQVPQIDRILTTGGSGSWPERQSVLQAWQRAAAPEIEILVGAGLSPEVFSDPAINEIHVGRAARQSHESFGAVDRLKVARLKEIWASAPLL
jgi:copper homeostasis protein